MSGYYSDECEPRYTREQYNQYKGKLEEIEMQEGFENRKICNIMWVGLITNVLFDTEAREVGGEEWGLLRKVRLFKCPGCEKLTDELFVEKVCIDCDNLADDNQ